MLPFKRSPCMKIVMAGLAEHQRLAATGSHDLDPEWLLPTIVSFQVFECPNMMDFDLRCQMSCLTDFTDLCQESLFQFRSTAPFPLGSVCDGCLNVPGKCDPSPCRYQRLLFPARHSHLKYPVSLPLYLYFPLIVLVHLSHGGFVFVRERLC